MIIKCGGTELFLAKTRISILNSLGNEISIPYSELKRIEYCLYDLGIGGGYIFFFKKNGKTVKFEFNSKNNKQIQRGVELIGEKFPEIEIQEISKDSWPFYRKDWFVVLMMFCCCFPLGLFLMWYYKKYTRPVRVMFTILFLSLGGIGIFNAWQNYQITKQELNTAMQQAYQNLETIYQDIQPDETNIVDESSESESEEDTSVFEVGDVFESDDLSIMYIDSGEYSSDNMFIEPADGNKFIYIELSIQNTGDSDLSIGGASFDCYADDSHCSQSVVTADDQMEIISTLSPDKYLKGKIYFEVPKDAQDIEVQFETDFWTEDKIYFIVE